MRKKIAKIILGFIIFIEGFAGTFILKIGSSDKPVFAFIMFVGLFLMFISYITPIVNTDKNRWQDSRAQPEQRVEDGR